jgi:REP element-mobilizing transposase RayT
VTEKYRNKYRIASSRLPGYDYSRNGAYFITVCTYNRENLFGDVIVVPGDTVETGPIDDVETGLRPVSTTTKSTEIKLSDFGKIVSDCWYDLPNHYPNIILDQFIIMPNHIHGIIIIQNYPGSWNT